MIIKLVVETRLKLFLRLGKFYWTGSGGQKKNYLGTGNNQQCSCANDYTTCGGDQTKAVLMTRYYCLRVNCVRYHVECSRDRMVVGFKTTCAISTYHH